MINPEQITNFVLMLAPLLLSLTLHEYAHARTALAFGDPTAKLMGRCTLNPLVHLDLVGTLCLIFANFGWAKPVPVNPNNLHPRRLGDIMVSLAGPLSNLGLAVVCGVGLRLMISFNADMSSPVMDGLWTILIRTFGVNICLAVFNMIPLFPLDGHHVLREHLPEHMQAGFMYWQMRYGQFALMALIVLPQFIKLPIDPIGYLFSHAVGLAARIVLFGVV